MAEHAQPCRAIGIVHEEIPAVHGMRVVAADARELPAHIRRVGPSFRGMGIAEAEACQDMGARAFIFMTIKAEPVERLSQKECRVLGPVRVVAGRAARLQGRVDGLLREQGFVMALKAELRLVHHEAVGESVLLHPVRNVGGVDRNMAGVAAHRDSGVYAFAAVQLKVA